MAPRTRSKTADRDTSQLLHMTLDQLRRQLKAANLPTAGNKKTLAERLIAHLANKSPQRGQSSTTQSNQSRRHSHRQRNQLASRGHQLDSDRGRHIPSRQRSSKSPTSIDSCHHNRRTRFRSRSARRNRSPHSSSSSDRESCGRYSPWRSLAHLHRHARRNRLDSSSDDDFCQSTHRHHRSRLANPRRHKKHHKKRPRRSSSSSSSETSTSGSSSSSSPLTSDSSEQASSDHKKKRHRHHRRHGLKSRTKPNLKQLSVSCYPPLPDRYVTRIKKAKNPKTKWDHYKENLFIWCFSPKPASVGLGNHASAWDTRNSFRPKANITSRLGPAPDTTTHTMSGTEICIRFNTPRGCAKGDTCMCATAKAAKETILHASVPPEPSQLNDIRTPLRLPNFRDELSNHPDPAWVSDLLRGIEHGVPLGYHGPRCQRISRNLNSAFQHPEVIDDELDKEVTAQRILGPFHTSPVPNLQCSRVGVVPKKSGGWRMIMHLSAPTDNSINDGTDKEEYTLRYSTIDDAVRMVHHLGSNAELAKIDIKSAFRTIPVRTEDRELLGIHWRNHFYIDRCLPFGLRSAPFIFNEYAEALEWILKHNYIIAHVIHYLDDFLIAGRPGSTQCQDALHRVLEVCKRLGFPIAVNKVEGPTTIITFLGILIDTVAMELRLPPEKLEALMQLLQQWQITRRKTTKRELLSLIGKLSFAAKVIPAGRIFLRRLIDLSTTVKKLHHRINLNASARADIKWWQDFLPGWNGVGLMLQAEWVQASDIELFTDASGKIGFGAYYNKAWIAGRWSGKQLEMSIQWKELYAIVAAAATWGHQWKTKKIIVHCDNQAIVHVWQAKKPKNALLAQLCRTLLFLAAKNN